MIRRKICLLGAFAVGKTSLVRRFVHSLFDERYQTTIGVKIDKKLVLTTTHDGRALEVTLVIWDIHGEDELQKVRASYLRGSSGLLFVVDGTRRATLDVALELEARARAEIGDIPTRVLLNKADLVDAWEVDPAEVRAASGGRWAPVATSARSGAGVEEVFQSLVRAIALADAGQDTPPEGV
ncbi:MAG: Rab family GTPase [Planctomycetota bacterium]